MFILRCFVSTYLLVILVYEPLSCSLHHWCLTCIVACINSRIGKRELGPFQVFFCSFQQVISVPGCTVCPFVVEENNLHSCSVILADPG